MNYRKIVGTFPPQRMQVLHQPVAWKTVITSCLKGKYIIKKQHFRTLSAYWAAAIHKQQAILLFIELNIPTNNDALLLVL